MPLRDHFRPPLSESHSWEAVHGQWPAMIVQHLFGKLPPGYVAEPRVHPGRGLEIDLSAFEGDDARPADSGEGDGGLAVYAPAQATVSVTAALPDPAGYEVRVYDTRRRRQLVAAVEIVSPSNKDRPESRRLFVDKCVALLREGVSVSIIDLVTDHHFNLYADLMASVGRADPAFGAQPPAISAAALRWRKTRRSGRLEAWAYPLAVGQPLPLLPLWLAERLAVKLELEPTYQDTCRVLYIP